MSRLTRHVEECQREHNKHEECECSEYLVTNRSMYGPAHLSLIHCDNRTDSPMPMQSLTPTGRGVSDG